MIDNPDESLAEPAHPITCKADVFSYGLTLWEMLSLCLPHSDLLGTDDDEDDSEEEEEEEEDNDAAYREALGTRPPLPDLPHGVDYGVAAAVFVACTETDPARRPRADEIVDIWSD